MRQTLGLILDLFRWGSRADLAGGSYHMVMAVLAAVIDQQQLGEGQYIDLSINDAVFSVHALNGAKKDVCIRVVGRKFYES